MRFHVAVASVRRLRASTRLLVIGFVALAAGFTASDAAFGRGLVYSRHVRELTADHLPNLQSPVAYVVEWPSGRVILEKAPDQVRPVASLSKLMGMLVIADECHLKAGNLQEVTRKARKAAALQGGNRYSKLRVGWSYTITDLMHAAMLKSDNRALPALAEACGLDAAGLGQRMTMRAKKMGLTHTAFVEPDGLSEKNVSTAREMTKILQTALGHPLLRSIMAKSRWTITGHKGKRTERIELRNTDHLVFRDGIKAIGGKTGFTNLARYCLAAAAKLPAGHSDARAVAMVFLGAEGRDTRFGDFMRMYKWMTLPQYGKYRVAHAETIHVEAPAVAVVAPAVQAPVQVAAGAVLAEPVTQARPAALTSKDQASAVPLAVATPGAAAAPAAASASAAALPPEPAKQGWMAKIMHVIERVKGG